jgi:hypothetical protein
MIAGGHDRSSEAIKTPKKGELVYGRKIGRLKLPVGQTTGATRPCRLEGCCGVRMVVKWEDGQVTYPCSKGMVWRDSAWHIL